MNFNDLGEFETQFLDDCSKLELSKPDRLEKENSATINDCAPNILLLGEAYGRLSMRVLRKTPSGISNLIVNELAEANIDHLSKKLATLKGTGGIQTSSRVKIIVGDCLELPVNDHFLKATNQDKVNNYFDLIMCANVLHFFDGKQVLNFFVNTFNFLRPGGHAHIFTHTGRSHMCTGISLSEIYFKTLEQIEKIATKDNKFLFPGLIDDEWLDNKSFIIDFTLKQKPNKIRFCNLIPQTTINTIATKLGFTVLSATKYLPAMDSLTSNYTMINREDGIYSAFVLEKPATFSGASLSIEDIDQDLVKNCLDARLDMKKLIDTKVEFINEYPYAIEKTRERSNTL